MIRNRRSANLIFQAVVSAGGAASRDIINFFCQFSGLLPGTYFLKLWKVAMSIHLVMEKDDKAYGEGLEDLKPET